MDDEVRAFKNPYADYDGKDNASEVTSHFRLRISEHIGAGLDRLHGHYDAKRDRDQSVYTGSSGIALLYLKLAQAESSYDHYLQNAAELVETSRRARRLTFLCGDSGPLALSCVLREKLGERERSKQLARDLSRLGAEARDASLPSEYLYGHVGYLYSLLFVRAHLGEGWIDESDISRLCEVILESGKAGSRKFSSLKSPLVYTWHDKLYIGAAHGISGIIYALLQVHALSPVSDHLYSHVKPTVDFLLTLKFPSGNYQSSFSNKTDRLVHWCHGAPGLVHAFVKAYEVFNEERYLAAARECAEVVWKRGLLLKGDGICHGTAGNAYAFLILYQTTKESKYLHRACKFAEWCMNRDKSYSHPDHPWSLYEGLAGVLYFLADILDPMQSRFPGFALPRAS